MENITISKDLTESCKTSHTRYQCYLSEQRKIQNDEEARKKTLEESELKKKEELQLDLERNIILKSIKVAENYNEKGNTELENITKTKTINRDKLIDSQNKTRIGLKRKAELALELEAMNKKIKEKN